MFDGGFDGGEGGEVDFDESDVGGWDGGGDVGDEGVGAGRVAAGEVDFGRVVFCEGEDGGGADAGGAWSGALVWMVCFSLCFFSFFLSFQGETETTERSLELRISSQEDDLASEVGQFLVGIEVKRHDGTFAENVEQSIKT